ncbi:Hypp3658 [Branchiostoma lanceolatum]|uniref:Hypp3658 protein n=1 Tax=Branchiostoma lanceolatum TaxID=7740 RepID=A0A8K0EY97_BRALA|nr:Hypp3658 [Branchiostoma lanceolatum]
MFSLHVHAVLVMVCSTLALQGLGESVLDRVRLSGGPVPNRGRLQIHYKTAWWPVCADSWDLNETQV